VFRFGLKDGGAFEKRITSDRTVVDIARNIHVEFSPDSISVSWDPVAGVRNYSVALYESDNGTTIRDTGLGCDTGDATSAPESPPGTACVIGGLAAALVPRQEYILSVGSWGIPNYTSGGDAFTSFSGNHSEPFIWQP
jgi:hypothetical protein